MRTDRLNTPIFPTPGKWFTAGVKNHFVDVNKMIIREANALDS